MQSDVASAEKQVFRTISVVSWAVLARGVFYAKKVDGTGTDTAKMRHPVSDASQSALSYWTSVTWNLGCRFEVRVVQKTSEAVK